MWVAKVLTVSILSAGALVGLAYIAGKKVAKKKEIYMYDEDEEDAKYEQIDLLEQYDL